MTIRRVALALLLLAGCDRPDFDPPSVVAGPRVLAIVADRPEVAPGDEVRVRAMIAGVEGRDVELRWSMCIDTGPITASDVFGGGAFNTTGQEQYGGDFADPGCDEGGRFTTPLVVEDGAALVPGACDDPSEPWRCTAGLASIATGAPEAAPLLEFGLPFVVNVALWVDGEFELRAYKRVAITDRTAPGTNPPRPRFAVGDVWLTSRDGDDPFECAPEGGERPVVPGVADVRLRPDPDDEAWRETFPVITLDGTRITGEENAYYSWFADGGELDPEVTVAPARDAVWTTPDERGVHEIWVVVRDGHLGQSACRAEVEVVDVVPPYGGISRL